MITSKDAETTKDAVEAGQKMAERLNKMSKTATELAKEGKTLGKVDQLLQDVTFFGKAATVLGVVGAGLGVLTLILGSKSAAEQNTELLTAIQGQISQLSTDMKRLFENADKTAHMIAAQQLWDQKFDLLSDYHSRYEHFVASKEDAYRHHLLELKQQDLMHLADTFGDLMHQSLAQENLLLATYNSSFGDEQVIVTIGTHVLQEAYFLYHLCFVIGETIRSTAPDRTEELNSDDEINARFTVAIARIAESIQTYAQECRVNCWKNVEEFLDQQQFRDTHLDWAGYFAASATAIGESLQRHWPRYDWSVIVYDAVGGFNRHGVASSGIYRKDYLRRECGGSGTGNIGNIIVAAADTNAHNFDPANETDLRNVWYDLTLNERATVIPKNALDGFQGRKRNGLFFYCLKEGMHEGVRMNYWSRAAHCPDRDKRTNINIYNQGAWQEGRIISSEINIRYHGADRSLDIYYQTLCVMA